MKTIFALALMISFSAFAEDADLCAFAFNSLDYEYTSRLEIRNRDRIRDLARVPVQTGGGWDNRISAVAVRNGCTLVGYQYKNFNVDLNTRETLDGFVQVFENHNQRGLKFMVLGSETNERISSLKCVCL